MEHASKYSVSYVNSRRSTKHHLAWSQDGQAGHVKTRLCDNMDVVEAGEYTGGWYFYSLGPYEPHDPKLERELYAKCCVKCLLRYAELPVR